MRYFSFSIRILVSIFVHYPAVNSDFDYCSISCNGKEHTMCKYPKDGGPECSDFQRGLTKGEKNFVVHVHNELRDMVSAGKGQYTAADMMEMIWCKEAEQIAQRWADQCTVLDDRLDDCRTLSQTAEPGGQLVAYAGEMNLDDTYNFIRQTVMKWFLSNESHFNQESVFRYKYDSKSFAYSQIVWARTDRVGCGLSKGMVGDTPVHRFVCNYYPAGNIQDEPVYITGRPCSKCPFAKCSKHWRSLCKQQTASTWNRPSGSARVIHSTYGIFLVFCIIVTTF